ncbi:MAG: hypothetical protein AB7F28_08205 [Candidatus Margulisiibacteriota bacterium]
MSVSPAPPTTQVPARSVQNSPESHPASKSTFTTSSKEALVAASATLSNPSITLGFPAGLAHQANQAISFHPTVVSAANTSASAIAFKAMVSGAAGSIAASAATHWANGAKFRLQENPQLGIWQALYDQKMHQTRGLKAALYNTFCKGMVAGFGQDIPRRTLKVIAVDLSVSYLVQKGVPEKKAKLWASAAASGLVDALVTPLEFINRAVQTGRSDTISYTVFRQNILPSVAPAAARAAIFGAGLFALYGDAQRALNHWFSDHGIPRGLGTPGSVVIAATTVGFGAAVAGAPFDALVTAIQSGKPSYVSTLREIPHSENPLQVINGVRRTVFAGVGVKSGRYGIYFALFDAARNWVLGRLNPLT